MKKRSIKTKITALNLASVLAVVLIFFGITLYQKSQANRNIDQGMDKLINENIGTIAKGLHQQLAIIRELLENEVRLGLKLARDTMNRQGAVTLNTKETVEWEAVNQFNEEKQTVRLPKLMVGGQWLGQNAKMDTPSPVVDEVLKEVGGTTTIFQKMNEQGDMLRVSTNVIKTDGNRAIGTYIPAVNPDGKPNPVIEAVMKGQTFNGRAYVVNAWYLTSYEPIYDGDKNIVGALYFGIRQEKSPALRNGILEQKVGETGYIYILNGKGKEKGNYVISKNGERDGENILNAKDDSGRYFIQLIIQKALALKPGEAAFERYPWKNIGETKPRMKRVAITYFEPWDWVIGASVYEDDFGEIKREVGKSLNSIVFWMIVSAVAALIIVFIVSFVMTGKITNPLNRVVELVKDVAEGEGDLTKRVTIDTNDEVREVGDWFNVFVEKLEDMIVKIKKAATGIHDSMEEVAAESNDLAERTNEQAASLTETSTTLEEFTQSVRSNSEHAGETEMMLENLDHELKSRSGLVGDVTATMSTIFESSKKIDNIITVINDISFQTNLLALNAAVEAARAGEAGRGFAVVASEVRNLAQKTAESSKSIQTIVTGNVEATRKGMGLVKQTSDFFAEISTIMEEMVEKVKTITRSSKEQQTGIEQINQAIFHLDEVSGQNAQLVEALSKSARSMRVNTQQLEEMVATFSVSE